MTALKAPFPWFGGKSRAAPIIWPRFGAVRNYVEPFAGSLAVLLAAPHGGAITETVNDLDGFIANFWRSVASDPDEVWRHADWPVSEIDLHARHIHLVNRRHELTDRLIGDPNYYDPMLAGWWVWGISQWIGSGWCSGKGPWNSDGERLINIRNGDTDGHGVNRQKPNVGNSGKGVQSTTVDQMERLHALSSRLRNVRVCCGGWERVLTKTVTTGLGLTGVMLDPPYSSQADRVMNLYAADSSTVAHDVREWAMANGHNPLLRIAVCGYDGEHDELGQYGWTVESWTAAGGYGAGKGTQADENKYRERIWFSPHCIDIDTQEVQLFEVA